MSGPLIFWYHQTDTGWIVSKYTILVKYWRLNKAKNRPRGSGIILCAELPQHRHIYMMLGLVLKIIHYDCTTHTYPQILPVLSGIFVIHSQFTTLWKLTETVRCCSYYKPARPTLHGKLGPKRNDCKGSFLENIVLRKDEKETSSTCKRFPVNDFIGKFPGNIVLRWDEKDSSSTWTLFPVNV